MVALQLLVALVVLLTSDGVLSSGNLQCAYKDQEFCHHLLAAYAHNKDAILEEYTISKVTNMAALQLLVALVVLLTSGGALSHGNPLCDDMKCYMFCVYAMEAHEENNKAIRQLHTDSFKVRWSKISLRYAEVIMREYRIDYWPSASEALIIKELEQKVYAI
ncbi:hypothetical protein Q1695_004383 [Nippostrongylus brasiliensis]|nr:hypothetical protein Q1695_004383 [Nippostrongylus brasiliensis]